MADPNYEVVAPMVPFGCAMRKSYFTFADTYTPLNHGSYGGFPTVVRARQRELQEMIDARPDPFLRKVFPGLLAKSRAAIAPLLGASTEEVVLIPNASTSINTVLRNLVFKDGDVIVYFNSIYPACEKTVEYVCETTAAQSSCIGLQYPIEDEEVIQKFRDSVRDIERNGKKVKLAMFDTVLTFPGVRVPWERLVKTCKELGVLSLVDGAHGIGHIDLRNLGEIGPDFFTSNCYKWLYLPRGCAVFYVPIRNQSLIRSSLPTCHGYRPLPNEEDNKIHLSSNDDRDLFGELFAWVATIDTTPYICVPEALKFRHELCGGEENIRNYSRNIVQAGAKRVAEILGTEVMENKTQTLQRCCFANIRLPLMLNSSTSFGFGAAADHIQDTTGRQETEEVRFTVTDAPKIIQWLIEKLVDEFDTFIAARLYAGAIWIRLSGQIYLELNDFDRAGYWLKDLCQRLKSEEGLAVQ